MKIASLTTLAFTIWLASLVGQASGADEKFDAAARAKAIAPWIDEQTFAVAHVDLRRASVEAAADEIGALKALPAEGIAAMKMVGGMYQQRLVAAGAKDIYAFVAMTSGRPYLRVFGAIPLDVSGDEKVIRSMFPMFAAERRGDVLLIAGDRTMLAEVKANVAEPRPELAAAVEAAGDTAAQLFILPPKYWKRVIDEGIGEFPKQFGGGPTSVLSRGAVWIAAGIDFPPHPAARITIQSQDAQSAAALHDKMAEWLRLGKAEDRGRVFPDYDKFAELVLPQVKGDRLEIVLDESNHGVERLLSSLTRPIQTMERRSAQAQSSNNLKQIALAMHNYHSAHKGFPLPASLATDGKPLLSWRVAILPYLGEEDLYKKFHLDEPWDSPNNRPLADKMPSVYRLPITKNTEPGRTNYLLPVGNGAGFTADKPTEIKDITDGTSNTIMIIEVDDDHAVPWTKPDDWQFDPQQPAKGLGQFFDGRFNAAFFDGSVHSISAAIDPKTLKALFTRAGGEPVGSY